MPSERDKLVMDAIRIYKLLDQHKQKNFVQRILSRRLFPSIPTGKPGESMTHQMAWGEMTGRDGNPRYVMYPTVVQQPDRTLLQLDPMAASQYALKTGEFIDFDNPEDAEWFSKNYKKIWALEGQR